MATPSSRVITHHSTACAARNVLPEPLHDRTATRGSSLTASNISRCLSQRSAPKT